MAFANDRDWSTKVGVDGGSSDDSGAAEAYRRSRARSRSLAAPSNGVGHGYSEQVVRSGMPPSAGLRYGGQGYSRVSETGGADNSAAASTGVPIWGDDEHLQWFDLVCGLVGLFCALYAIVGPLIFNWARSHLSARYTGDGGGHASGHENFGDVHPDEWAAQEWNASMKKDLVGKVNARRMSKPNAHVDPQTGETKHFTLARIIYYLCKGAPRSGRPPISIRLSVKTFAQNQSVLWLP